MNLDFIQKKLTTLKLAQINILKIALSTKLNDIPSEMHKLNNRSKKLDIIILAERRMSNLQCTDLPGSHPLGGRLELLVNKDPISIFSHNLLGNFRNPSVL